MLIALLSWFLSGYLGAMLIDRDWRHSFDGERVDNITAIWLLGSGFVSLFYGCVLWLSGSGIKWADRENRWIL